MNKKGLKLSELRKYEKAIEDISEAIALAVSYTHLTLPTKA